MRFPSMLYSVLSEFTERQHASLLNTNHYKVQIKGKWNNPGKGVASFQTPRCSSYWKENLRVSLNYGQPIYLLIYQFSLSLYIYIYIYREREREREESFNKGNFYLSINENHWMQKVNFIYLSYSSVYLRELFNKYSINKENFLSLSLSLSLLFVSLTRESYNK